MINKTDYIIQEKYAPFIKEIYQDEQGISCQLNEGFHFILSGTTNTSKGSISEIKEQLKWIGKH